MEIKDEKQIKAIEWINGLMQYVEENKLPLRILDEVEDCRKQISSDNVDWYSVDHMISELLENIEEKTSMAVVQNENKKMDVTAEAIETQLKRMAQRCHSENISSVDGMTERKNIIIKKNNEQLIEISHTNAHLEELKNENMYIQFFQMRKAAYEKDASEMFRELIQSISSNYNHMLNSMKSMFNSIDGYKIGIGNEKFYNEYEELRVGIDKKVLGEAETADIGGNDILSFGYRTKDKIKSIVKKVERKRKVLAWVPLIILIVLFMISAVVQKEPNSEVNVSTESITVSDSQIDNVTKEIAVDIAKEVGKQATKNVSLSAVKSIITSVASFVAALVASLGILLIFILLLIIVIYNFYLKKLKVWCDKQITKESGSYLKAELIQFEHNNYFAFKLDNIMKTAADEYEQQYMNVLSNIFKGAYYDSNNLQQSEASKVSFLREEWNKIKYE